MPVSPNHPKPPAATRILIIDDDRELCALIKTYLEPLGYEVIAEHDGPAGEARALAEPFSAVILDVNLPGMDGFEVLKRLRNKTTLPILMLTSRGEETDRIVGLEMGADDYLPKTFSSRELLARLRAVMRRSIITQNAAADRRNMPVTVGDLYVDPAAHAAFLAGEPMVLTRQEFDLLVSLVRAAGRVKTRESLLLEVAERDFEA